MLRCAQFLDDYVSYISYVLEWLIFVLPSAFIVVMMLAR